MAKTTLPTNYVDDVLNGAMDGKRRYREIPNADGTISLEDATTYDQVGSNFGASQLNLMSDNINQSFDANKMLKTMDEVNAVTQEGYGVDALVVKQVNDSLVKTISLPDVDDIVTAMTTALEANVIKSSGAFNFLLSCKAGNYCVQAYATGSHASGIITQQAMTNGWQFYHQFGGADTVLKKLGSEPITFNFDAYMPMVNSTTAMTGPSINLGGFYEAGYTEFTVNVISTSNGSFNVTGIQTLTASSVITFSSEGFGDARGQCNITVE